MASLKFLAVSLGVIGLVLAGNWSHAATPAASARAVEVQARIEYGGISAQTATAAGSVDAGAAWFTLRADGLRREISTR